jgi:hypothetical protein
MNTALEYSTRVVQEGGRRCKKSTLNDLVHLTPLRIPLMNPPLLTNGLTDERGFFPHIASRPFRGCIYIAAGCQEPFFSLADGA